MIKTNDVTEMLIGFEKTEIRVTTSVYKDDSQGKWPKQAPETCKTILDFQGIFLSVWISLPRLPHGSLHQNKDHLLFWTLKKQLEFENVQHQASPIGITIIWQSD